MKYADREYSHYSIFRSSTFWFSSHVMLRVYQTHIRESPKSLENHARLSQANLVTIRVSFFTRVRSPEISLADEHVRAIYRISKKTFVRILDVIHLVLSSWITVFIARVASLTNDEQPRRDRKRVAEIFGSRDARARARA